MQAWTLSLQTLATTFRELRKSWSKVNTKTWGSLLLPRISRHSIKRTWCWPKQRKTDQNRAPLSPSVDNRMKTCLVKSIKTIDAICWTHLTNQAAVLARSQTFRSPSLTKIEGREGKSNWRRLLRNIESYTIPKRRRVKVAVINDNHDSTQQD